MIDKKPFHKVKPVGKVGIVEQFTRIKSGISSKIGNSDPIKDYKSFQIREALSRMKKNIPYILALSIAIIGLFIIDTNFQPIQTPQQIYSKLANLNLMNALLLINLFWLFIIKSRKIPIFRW